MFIEPDPDAVRTWLATNPEGPIVMLNLLRFREVADYSRSPVLAPKHPISGAEAYARYAAHTQPFLVEAGASVTYMGYGRAPIIGPPEERWDEVLLVQHRSAQAFLDFATNKPYLAGVGHRTAALSDSRLIPLRTADLPRE